MKLKTKLLSIDAATIGVIAHFIRFPSKSPLGMLIRKNVIPAIAMLQQKYPLRMTCFFPTEFLQSFYVTQDVNCTNLVMMDTIFDSFKLFNDFIKARDWDAWVECQLQVELPGGPSLDLLNTGLFMPVDFSAAIKAAREAGPCGRCMLSDNNNYLPTPPRDASPATPSRPTAPATPMMMATPMATPQAQQPIGHPQSSSHVLAGEEEDDISESDDEVTPLDWNSSMDDELLYMFKVNFKPQLDYNTRVFYLTDYEGRFEETERQRGFAAKANYPETLEEFEKWYRKQLTSGKRPNCQTFLGLDYRIIEGHQQHIWCSSCLMVPEIHQEWVQSSFYCRSFYTTEGWRRPVNTSLNVPRLSKEIKDNQEVYQMLLDALCPVFEWIYTTLKHLFPDTFLSLSISVQFLPNSTMSPMYPFAGFILNINVSTCMHRDTGDKDICLVLVISDCVGRELVLVEPSVVLRMRSGDVVVFPSKAFTHLNLHFKGKHISLVLHTDKCMKGWEKNGNGWLDNATFRFVMDDDDHYSGHR
ncbi:hypothetical protein CPB84DRAFT_1841968 [Gymnopilus junonius]|uniref:Uncharacterized protein n=1 Tax=Gymnopilus junonius TaxID=109634 RepID=A0A9P5NWA0_GYMJU|nr:hypothetical protein CPB84DRAFT_1841968 [Gymnopilus junonius]